MCLNLRGYRLQSGAAAEADCGADMSVPAECQPYHDLMMQALDSRDCPWLGQILREHLRHKAQTVHESLADLDSSLGHAADDAQAETAPKASARRQRRRNDPR